MKEYGKLVRDLIPEIITSSGSSAIMHIATEAEYRTKLYEKLVEEAGELAKSQSIEEVADVLEVVIAICKFEEWTKYDLEVSRLTKREERGAFTKRIILDSIT